VGANSRSDFDSRLLEQAKREFRFYEERLNFQYLTTLPLQNLLTELSHLPPRTLVFYTTASFKMALARASSHMRWRNAFRQRRMSQLTVS
jgi:hypothetical protein